MIKVVSRWKICDVWHKPLTRQISNPALDHSKVLMGNQIAYYCFGGTCLTSGQLITSIVIAVNRDRLHGAGQPEVFSTDRETNMVPWDLALTECKINFGKKSRSQSHETFLG